MEDPSERRRAELDTLYAALEAHLGRPARVLDLGCGLSFYSLTLAARGARVTAINCDWNGIRAYDQLAAQNPAMRVRLTFDVAEEFASEIPSRPYDLVLALDTAPDGQGLGSAPDWVRRHAALAVCGVFSVPLPDGARDGPATAAAGVRDLARGFEFSRVLDFEPANPASAGNLLLFASNRVWFLDGSVQAFRHDALSANEMSRTHGGTRRCFVGADRIAKLFRLEEPFAKANLSELETEAKLLSSALPASVNVPRLIAFGKSDFDAWLVRGQDSRPVAA